jgi:ABC-type Fe3+/spermidine/putrescine transport system ATPase subunit
MNGSAPLVRLQQVCKRYGDQVALTDVDLDIFNGEFVTILGPSGCGKTTLLRLIAGFEPVSSGRIQLNGRDVAGMPPEKREVNTVFQSYALFPHMTVFDNVAFGLRMRGQTPEEIRQGVGDALNLVQLTGFEGRRPHQLSGGQQQRVAVARALLTRPDVVFGDEPTGNLDSATGAEVLSLLRRSSREMGQTIIMVTHDPAAAAYADRVVLLADGQLAGEITDPTPDNVLASLAKLNMAGGA